MWRRYLSNKKHIDDCARLCTTVRGFWREDAIEHEDEVFAKPRHTGPCSTDKELLKMVSYESNKVLRQPHNNRAGDLELGLF